MLCVHTKDDFWLLMGLISKACTCNLREQSDTADQLQMAILAFRTLVVVGSSSNRVNPFDGGVERAVSPLSGGSA